MLQRNGEGNQGAGGGDGRDRHLAVKSAGALLHAGEAEAGGLLIGVEADAVVLDGELEFAFGEDEGEADFTGAGVAGDVGEGFLEKKEYLAAGFGGPVGGGGFGE